VLLDAEYSLNHLRLLGLPEQEFVTGSDFCSSIIFFFLASMRFPVVPFSRFFMLFRIW